MDKEKQDRTKKHERIFLVVVDRTEELHTAIRYACLRAKKSNGRVALVTFIEPSEFRHFLTVNDLMEDEARENAEELILSHAANVKALSGLMPILYIREGDPVDTLMDMISEEKDISILVLAAGTDKKGPGPLISAFSGKHAAHLPIPLTIVPGSLTKEQIESLT